MISVEANPFGGIRLQPRIADAGKVPEKTPTAPETVFVVPKAQNEAATFRAATQIPNPLVLISNALGMGQLSTYVFGSRSSTGVNGAQRTTGTSLTESWWEGEIDPETGETREIRAMRRIPEFLEEKPDNPFSRSLDLRS